MEARNDSFRKQREDALKQRMARTSQADFGIGLSLPPPNFAAPRPPHPPEDSSTSGPLRLPSNLYEARGLAFTNPRR